MTLRKSIRSTGTAMLAHEWRELELLWERIAGLRERLAAAQKTGNTGLVEGLNAEMERVIRVRDRLVRHISTRLGATAAAPAAPADPPYAACCGNGSGTGRNSALVPARD